MTKSFSRRDFIRSGIAAGAAVMIKGGSPALAGQEVSQAAGRRPCVVASGNGFRSTAKAMRLLRQG
ncbi:MAG TPA: twin-arginine translocation signal domain-containing protein, partial [Acidobacteriota bacterium]